MDKTRPPCKAVFVNVLAIAAMMIGVIGFLAAAPGAPSAPRPSASVPPRSPAPLSKYQRAKQEQYRESAPADQYFGKMKLSFLGINNTFRDAAISAGDHTVDPAIVNKVEFADDALRDWSSHFPRDPQLARTYFLAIGIHKKIWLKPNQERAWLYMSRITTQFATTYFGKLVKKDIAIGFTEHYYSEALPCPTPTPTPTPAPTPTLTPIPNATASAAARARPPARSRATPTPTPSPTLTPTPEPTPTPSPVPTPVPTPQVLGKGLKVQIETPGCVPLPSPTPTATPTRAPTEAPAPTITPLPTVTPLPTATSLPAGPSSPSPSPKPSR